MVYNKQKERTHLALVVHAFNTSYSGGSDQEDHSSKPAQANSSLDPILGGWGGEENLHKKGLVNWLKV
jgi:hypothetical protein